MLCGDCMHHVQACIECGLQEPGWLLLTLSWLSSVQLCCIPVCFWP